VPEGPPAPPTRAQKTAPTELPVAADPSRAEPEIAEAAEREREGLDGGENLLDDQQKAE
jgi:hypothetical protein